jgi:5-formyltetrahydrofolate cyclo-ligase
LSGLSSGGTEAAAKASRRRQVQAGRAARSPAERARRDALRANCFFGAFDAWPAEAPRVVACYAAVPPEPATEAILAGLVQRGVAVLLPVVGPAGGGWRDPDWAYWDGSERLRSAAGAIPQPTAPPLGAAALQAASLVVMPGLAGDRSGRRLGAGGGWYDRALRHSQPKAPRWLLLNADEVDAFLPAEPWDEPVDALITEAKLLICSPPRPRPPS